MRTPLSIRTLQVIPRVSRIEGFHRIPIYMHRYHTESIVSNTYFIESHNVVSKAGPSSGDHDAGTHVLAQLLAELRGL